MASPSNKYHAVRTTVCGQTFDSKAEAKRFVELQMLERAKVISNLQTQVRFPLTVNGKHIAAYVADFVYRDVTGRQVVEDKKGAKTRIYSLKRKLMKACHNIDIVEV